MSETEIFEPCLVRKFKLGVEGGGGGGGAWRPWPLFQHWNFDKCYEVETSSNDSS